MMRRKEPPEFRRARNRAPNNDGLMCEPELQRATFRPRPSQDPVEFVYHSSPVGPAVSVYPRRYHEAQYKRQEEYGHSKRREDSSASGYDPRYHDTKQPSVPSKLKDHSSSYHQHYYPPARKQYYPDGGQRHPDEHVYHPSPSTRNHASSGYGRDSSAAHRSGTSRKVSTVEISPGVRVRLRGAAETRECILQDYYVPTMCYSCDLQMFCIRDASYVLCPTCRVVNPLDLEAAPKEHTYLEDGGGLGRGFTAETLQGVKAEAAAASLCSVAASSTRPRSFDPSSY